MDPRLLAIAKRLETDSPRAVRFSLGELIPISEEELRVQWAEATSGSALAQTRLDVYRVRANQQCMVCFQTYHPIDKETKCPYCGSAGAKILAGEEFHAEAIEVNGG